MELYAETPAGMKVLDNCYDQICTFDWLIDSYREARKRKRFRDDVMQYTDDLEVNLLEIQKELQDGTYETGNYHRFYVTQPKLRLVMSLQFKDRIVQWAIYRLLNPFYDKTFIEDSYACRIGKGAHRAADRLQYWIKEVSRKPGKWYYLKLDISKYFYRVDHEILLQILSRRIKDPRLMSLLEGIVNNSHESFGLPPGTRPEDIPESAWLNGVGMPIGNLTSQLFANIYLNELDQYCKHELRIHRYIRYMDDVIIILDSKAELREIWIKIDTFLREKLKLDLNNKTVIRPVAHGIEFVGYRIHADYRKVKRKTALRMRHALRKLTNRLAAGITTRTYFDRVCASFKGVLDHADTAGLRRKLNGIYIAQIMKHQEGIRQPDHDDKDTDYCPAVVTCG